MSDEKLDEKKDDINAVNNEVRVVVCGGINIDRFFEVDRMPIKGETIMSNHSFCGVGGKVF